MKTSQFFVLALASRNGLSYFDLSYSHYGRYTRLDRNIGRFRIRRHRPSGLLHSYPNQTTQFPYSKLATRLVFLYPVHLWRSHRKPPPMAGVKFIY